MALNLRRRREHLDRHRLRHCLDRHRRFRHHDRGIVDRPLRSGRPVAHALCVARAEGLPLAHALSLRRRSSGFAGATLSFS